MVLGLAAALVAVIAVGAVLCLTVLVRGRDAVERARSQVELLDGQRADLAARLTTAGDDPDAHDVRDVEALSERLAGLEGDVAAARRVHEDTAERHRSTARRARLRFRAVLSSRARGHLASR